MKKYLAPAMWVIGLEAEDIVRTSVSDVGYDKYAPQGGDGVVTGEFGF